ncbi:IS256 family transposase [Bradyrhizobium sp.]|uniref:IS256 family transposase n=1 Tax=Bradyrhizobium sp. TaxID=376 RepID=UPI002D74A586|nr:IS256 family transposase [Bradyrhizobium sp.]HZR75134.1 IS256 family transposase [Bradyrhizobium sp.]
MTDTNVFQLAQPGTFADPLTEVLRNGARALPTQAVEAEVAALLSTHADKLTEDGRARLVRHGHLPERQIMTGIGPVAVRCPRVRDRVGEGSERIRFSSAILPPYARRSKSLEVLIPILYLKGVSTGDFGEALTALLGKDAGGLSATTVGRLKDAWLEEHARWSKRDLSAKRYVYVWVDGIHVQARLEDAAQCLLVILGATPEGKKELVGLIDGVRESAQSWRELLLDLKRRGLATAPELAVADGALGFWQAVEEVWPQTRGQRCWVHKTANVLNKLPKSQQPKAKRALQEIWMTETKKDALAAFDVFVDTWGVKYDKAVACLVKDRDALLAFYDFRAEHWKHLRTSNVIESAFATVRHRTVRSKGCLSNKTALTMIFKLAEAAEKSWRRLDGHNQLPKLILGVKFTDGLEVVRPQVQAAAA